MLVTLFNGGLTVVDLPEMNIVKGWGRPTSPNGCGFAASPQEMAPSQRGISRASWLYVLNMKANRSSSPAITCRSFARTPTYQHQCRNAHAVDRAPGEQQCHAASPRRHPAGRPWAQRHRFCRKDADLIVLSPDSRRAYVTLRGPKPAPTIPQRFISNTPGSGCHLTSPSAPC